MRDIDIARNLLDKEKKAIVIVKDGNVIFSSEGKGIKPIYTALKEHTDELKGSSVADKVIGKAAAMICEYAGIKELSTKLISENAISILKKTSILYKYDESVPYIKNRDESGMCPVETLSLKANNIDELLLGISNFLSHVSHAGKPIIDNKTYIADGAHVIGKVTLKEYSSIWFNTVVRGDVNSIEIGRYTNIQDNSVVHVSNDYSTVIGDYVTIGHNAIIHGCKIEDHCLIGMGSIIMDGAVIGRGSIVAAGAVVKKNQIIPPFSVAAGIPAKVIKTMPENIDKIHSQALKYKNTWSIIYGIMPEAGGEMYDGGDIV